MKLAAFLDRDGVINEDFGFVYTKDRFVLCEGAIEAMHILCRLGYVLVVVTNQSGIARGLFKKRDFDALMRYLDEALRPHGIEITGVYACPHHPDGVIPKLSITCACRKPEPGLLLQAAADLNLCLPESILIGDRCSDVIAGRRAGLRNVYLVNQNHNPPSVDADGSFVNLLDCARALL